jgi:hypothetical protein
MTGHVRCDLILLRGRGDVGERTQTSLFRCSYGFSLAFLCLVGEALLGDFNACLVVGLGLQPLLPLSLQPRPVEWIAGRAGSDFSFF